MIYLMRHGLDDEKYIGGWSDVGLVPEGIEQTITIANKINESKDIVIKKIIASNVKRALETAEIVSPIIGVDNYESSDIIKEQNKGLLNGMLQSVAKEQYPEYMSDVTIDTVYPEGESLSDLYKRIKDHLEYFRSLPDDTLLITHRGVINMLYYILNDIPLDMDKKRFNVTHASVHALDKKNKSIRKVL